MSYMSKELSVLAYANGFTLWHYTTNDANIPAGYFNAAADRLCADDIIIANVDTAMTPKAVLLLITKAEDGVVIFNDMSPNTTCCVK